jgi:hypothetical protein
LQFFFLVHAFELGTATGRSIDKNNLSLKFLNELRSMAGSIAQQADSHKA